MVELVNPVHSDGIVLGTVAQGGSAVAAAVEGILRILDMVTGMNTAAYADVALVVCCAHVVGSVSVWV